MADVLHPALEPSERRRLLRHGVDLFNDARFFEAHETWEEVWRSTTPAPKQLLQGLIQIAVSMVHHRDRGRPDVARRVLAKGRARVALWAPRALGLDLADLLDQAARWDAWLATGTGAAPSLPRLHVVDPSELR